MNFKRFSKFHRSDIIRPMAREIVFGQALMLIMFFCGWEIWQGDIFLSGIIFVVFAATCNWLICLFTGQKIAGQLNAIQSAINEVKKGNFSFRIPSFHSTDKSNILVNEINLMLDSIASREEALMHSEDHLREMNTRLENLVEERTRQLNQSLCIVQERESELQKAQSIGSIGSWTYDFVTEAISWSEETFRIFGLPVGTEVSIQKIIELVHTDDRNLVNSAFQKGLSGKPYDFEHRILVSGKEKWIRGKVEIEHDSDGKTIKALGIVQDITAWKQAVIKLKESETRLDLAIRSAELGVWSWDINQKQGQFDEFVSELYGFDPPISSTTDDEFYRLIHPDDLETFRTALNSALEENKPFVSEYRIIRPDGSIRHLTARGALERNKNGNPQRFTGILCDITDKKLNEEMLQYLACVLDSSADAIVSTSLDNKISSWNKGAQNLLGYTPEEIIGQPEFILIPQELIDFEKEQFSKITIGGPEGKYESQRLRKNGTRVEVSIAIAPILGSKGEVFAISKVARDISERKQFEASLLEARNVAERATKAKSEFLANMSHEIRTPMNSILGFTELLTEAISDPRLKGYLAAIKTGGNMLLTLINDLLDLSKIEAGRMEIQCTPVDVASIMSEIEAVFKNRCEEGRIDFELVIPPAFPKSMMLDGIRLRQILVNLVGNAVKFTHHGSITLSVAAKRLKDKSENRCELRFSVRDTGIGIAPDQLELIFQAFQQQRGQNQAHYGGTGLGLAISRRLVDLMGGRLEVQSKPGVGSEFCVTIVTDIAEAAPHCESLSEIDLDIGFENCHILIVDDVSYNRALLKAMLEFPGITISEAEDGAEALDEVARHRPDLILTDVRMPMMDGYELAKRLRQQDDWRHIPLIAVTASVLGDAEKSALDAGFDAFLRKPVLRDQLMKLITRFAGAESKNCKKPKKQQISCKNDPALLAILHNEIIPECLTLRSRFYVSRVRQLGQRVINLAGQYQDPVLEKWSTSLMQMVDTFDTVAIKTALSTFEDMLPEPPSNNQI